MFVCSDEGNALVLLSRVLIFSLFVSVLMVFDLKKEPIIEDFVFIPFVGLLLIVVGSVKLGAAFFSSESFRILFPGRLLQ